MPNGRCYKETDKYQTNNHKWMRRRHFEDMFQEKRIQFRDLLCDNIIHTYFSLKIQYSEQTNLPKYDQLT